jgi:hypothetical protein
MLAEPLSVSVSPCPESRGPVTYQKTAAIASTLSRRINGLAEKTQDAAERRRLGVLRDVATKIHDCLAHVGTR